MYKQLNWDESVELDELDQLDELEEYKSFVRTHQEKSRDIRLCNTNRQSFNNGCLSNPTFTEENGVIFTSATKYLNNSLNFSVSANNRINESLTSTGSKIHAELVQSTFV